MEYPYLCVLLLDSDRCILLDIVVAFCPFEICRDAVDKGVTDALGTIGLPGVDCERNAILFGLGKWGCKLRSMEQSLGLTKVSVKIVILRL